MSLSTARKFVPYLGLSITILFLWLALRGIDFRHLAEVFRTANYGWIVVVAACVFLFYWLKVLRWQRILKHNLHAPARILAGPMMIGFAANNVLPMRLGELIRAYLAGKALGASNSLIIGSLLVERLLDLVAVLCILGLGILWVGNAYESLHQGGLWLALIAGGLFLALVFMTNHSATLKPWVSRRFTLGGRLSRRVAKIAIDFLDGLGILKTGSSLFLALSNSLIQWSMLVIAIYVSCRAVGMDVPLAACIVCLAMVTFAIALPAAPGFFGVVELAFVIALEPFGVSKELAIAAALYYHITLYALVTITGFIWLHHLGYRWNKLSVEISANSNHDRIKGNP